MRFLFSALAATAFAAAAAAGPKVAVVVGPEAPKLERFAADELERQFRQLFDAEVTVAGRPPAGVDHLVLVGRPATNPAVAEAAGDRWPKLSDQGHVLRSVKFGDRTALVVGGGSPVATLWAVYELGHHFGVRSFLHGDVMPEKTPELKLDGIDVTLEPAVRVRAWQVLGDSPAGLGGWGLDDHRQLLRQLAKLKFNHVTVAAPGRGAGVRLDGRRIPVSGDTPGRKAFKGAKEYDNPDLAGKTGEDRARALPVLADAVTVAARDLGMTHGDPGTGVATLTLAGLLPRAPTELAPGKEGWLVAAEVPGDLNPSLYLLARRAFDPNLTPKDAHAQLFTPILGAAAAERVALGFSHIEAAAALVAKSDPGLAELAPDVVLRHTKSADAPPEWWKRAGKLYAGGMDEMYRGIRATFNDPARPVLLYYAKRCEFAVHYFAAVDAARLAGVARAMGEKGEKDAVVTHLEKAVESTYNALNAYGDVARDPSDRGAIAALAEYAYRPLKAELKSTEK